MRQFARLSLSMLLLTFPVLAQDAGTQETVPTATCERLSRLLVSGGSITAAQAVMNGTFTPPGTAGAQPINDLPPFCRVTASARRLSDTEVGIEVWLPARGWNGEFRPASSGFAGGAITYGEMADLLRGGWATSNTNRGHDAAGAWKLSDMTSLPVHLMVQMVKPILNAYPRYPHGGRPPCPWPAPGSCRPRCRE